MANQNKVNGTCERKGIRGVEDSNNSKYETEKCSKKNDKNSKKKRHEHNKNTQATTLNSLYQKNESPNNSIVANDSEIPNQDDNFIHNTTDNITCNTKLAKVDPTYWSEIRESNSHNNKNKKKHKNKNIKKEDINDQKKETHYLNEHLKSRNVKKEENEAQEKTIEKTSATRKKNENENRGDMWKGFTNKKKDKNTEQKKGKENEKYEEHVSKTDKLQNTFGFQKMPIYIEHFDAHTMPSAKLEMRTNHISVNIRKTDTSNHSFPFQHKINEFTPHSSETGMDVRTEGEKKCEFKMKNHSEHLAKDAKKEKSYVGQRKAAHSISKQKRASHQELEQHYIKSKEVVEKNENESNYTDEKNYKNGKEQDNNEVRRTNKKEHVKEPTEPRILCNKTSEAWISGTVFDTTFKVRDSHCEETTTINEQVENSSHVQNVDLDKNILQLDIARTTNKCESVFEGKAPNSSPMDNCASSDTILQHEVKKMSKQTNSKKENKSDKQNYNMGQNTQKEKCDDFGKMDTKNKLDDAKCDNTQAGKINNKNSTAQTKAQTKPSLEELLFQKKKNREQQEKQKKEQKNYSAEIIRCELIWGPTKNKEPITPVESCELHPVVIIKDQFGHLYDDDEDNENNPIGKAANIYYRWSRGPPRTVCFFHPQKISCLQCTATSRCFCSYECFIKGFDQLHKYYKSSDVYVIPSHLNAHTYGVPCMPFDWENYENNIEFDEQHFNSLIEAGLLSMPDEEKWEIVHSERNYVPCEKDIGHQLRLETLLLDKNGEFSKYMIDLSDSSVENEQGEDKHPKDDNGHDAEAHEEGGAENMNNKKEKGKEEERTKTLDSDDKKSTEQSKEVKQKEENSYQENRNKEGDGTKGKHMDHLKNTQNSNEENAKQEKIYQEGNENKIKIERENGIKQVEKKNLMKPEIINNGTYNTDTVSNKIKHKRSVSYEHVLNTLQNASNVYKHENHLPNNINQNIPNNTFVYNRNSTQTQSDLPMKKNECNIPIDISTTTFISDTWKNMSCNVGFNYTTDLRAQCNHTFETNYNQMRDMNCVQSQKRNFITNASTGNWSNNNLSNFNEELQLPNGTVEYTLIRPHHEQGVMNEIRTNTREAVPEEAVNSPHTNYIHSNFAKREDTSFTYGNVVSIDSNTTPHVNNREQQIKRELYGSSVDKNLFKNINRQMQVANSETTHVNKISVVDGENRDVTAQKSEKKAGTSTEQQQQKTKKKVLLDDSIWNIVKDPRIYHKIITACCIPNITVFPKYNVTCFKNSGWSNPNNEFTVMTWNVLAEIYGTVEAFPHCDPYMLAWSYRKTKIIQEIIHSSPDIVCLQEIQNEHFLDFFKPSLSEFGYDGVYKQKAKEIFTSPSGKKRGGKYTIDGCAIFYNTKKLKFVETYAFEFSKLIKEASVFTLPKEIQKKPMVVKKLLKDNVALVLLLEYIQQYSKIYDNKEPRKNKKKLLIVANTHIVANPEANYVKIWQAQILVKVIEYLKICFIRKYETVPSLIVCGDFNSTPTSAVYQLIYRKTCDRSHEDFNSDKYSLLTELQLGHNLNLKSAYAISKILSQKLNPDECLNLELFEPVFTNYTGNFIGCLDYIFYNDENLNIISTVNVADEHQLMQEAQLYQLSNCALPSPIRPSDHLPLIAKFEFKIC